MFTKRLRLIAALVVIAALLLNSVVFAEGETPPPPEEETPAAEPEPAPVAPKDIHGSAENQAPGEESAAPASAAEPAPAGAAAGDPYWYVGSTLFASVFPSELCPIGTSELAGTCFKDASPIKRALTEIDGGLLPTDRTLYVTGSTSTYPAIDINDTVYTLALQMKALWGEDWGDGIPVVNGDIKIENVVTGFTIYNFIVNGGISIQESTGPVLIKDVQVSNHAGTGIGIDIGSFTTAHNGPITLQNVNSSANNQLGLTVVSANGTLKIINSSFDFNDDGVPIAMPGGLYASGGIFAGVINGAISLEGVSASRNAGYGAQFFYFDKPFTARDSLFNGNSNNSGLLLSNTSTAPITMDTIFASDNANYGVGINTAGTVQINKIEANHNTNSSGLCIVNVDTPASVRVSNGLFANNPNSHGLEITSLGAVTLTSIYSSKNGGDGLFVDNCQQAGGTGPCQGNGNILITSPAAAGFAGANGFFSNGSHGIEIVTKGAVTLTNLESQYNDKDGLYFRNYLGTGTLTINKNLPGWSNAFSENDNYGINIETMGSIVLSDTSAEKNGGGGLRFETSAVNPMNLTITNGAFSENNGDGINAPVFGNVTLTNVSASNNDWDWLDSSDCSGVYIDNLGNVTIRSSSPSMRSSFSSNSGYGLDISSYGSVQVSDINAVSNGVDGLYLNNTAGPIPGIVKVTRSAMDKNGYIGLEVETRGNVTLESVSASGNAMSGAYIDACDDDGSGGCLNLSTVTLRGSGNYFDANGGYGLTVYTKGAITATNIAANDNHNAGVYLMNNYNGTYAGVAIKSTGGFWNHITNNNLTGYDDAALMVYSNGALSLARVNASSNMYLGALLSNSSSMDPTKSLTLTDCHFDSNETGGLYTQINGPIIARGVTANYNSRHHFWMNENPGETVFDRLTSDTEYDTWKVDVDPGMLVRIDFASYDFDPVLEVYDEAGTLIYSDDNSGGGTSAQISFTNGGISQTISIHARSKDGSGNYWLSVNDPTRAVMTVYSAIGADLKNDYNNMVLVTSSTGIFSNFNENNDDGLKINTSGAAVLSNLGASDNIGNGLIVQALGNVSITNSHPTGISSFSNNGEYGIDVQTQGTITVRNRIWALYNLYDGIRLKNTDASVAKPVTLANVWLSNNLQNGANIVSGSLVTISNVVSEFNSGNGVYIENNNSPFGDVVVSGSNRFIGNSNAGISITSARNVLMSGVLADSNGKMGVYINSLSTLLRNVTAQHNLGNGLELYVRGNSLLDTVKAFDNGQGSENDGLYVESNGYNVTLLRCAFIGNEGSGIDFTGSGGGLFISGCFYYGNDTNNSGDPNINTP